MLDYIIPIASLVASLIAIYFTTRKQSSEIDNIDADTIAKLYKTIAEQEKRYDELKKEFETYKHVMNSQMAYLQSEASKWRNWAEKLSRQLKDNNIKPEEF
jgi:hypothetical protein